MGLIKAIAAADLNGAIGFENKLICRDKEDMDYFRYQTSNHAVIMGRKTFDSMGGKILKRRTNIVLTNSPEKFKGHDRLFYTNNHDLNSDFYTNILKSQDLWVIGGEQIYNKFLKYVDIFHVSRFQDRIKQADSYLPKIEKQFSKKYINRYPSFVVEEWHKINY